jgi:NADH dehydrogenase FAD-containing subunit
MLEDDTLVSALGGGIDLDVVPGVREHVDSLNTPETAVRIARKLQETPGTRVVVCGGRLTGLEAATEIADSHPETKVTLVTAGQLGDWRSPAARDYVRKAMQELGVEVHEHAKVTRVDADAVDTDTGVIDPFDLCVWAGGFTVPGLAADAGLKVDDPGAC